MVRGTPRHVVGYLKDFLFDEAQARAPVRSLCGGGKGAASARADHGAAVEPAGARRATNDLDVGDAGLLQEALAAYDGTVLLVSHDRDFLDRVATGTVALECGGRATVTRAAGATCRRRRARSMPVPTPRPSCPGRASPPCPPRRRGASKAGLSFTESHRLAALPDEIARLEAEIAKLAEFLSDPAVYTSAPAKAEKASAGPGGASGKARRRRGGVADAGGEGGGLTQPVTGRPSSRTDAAQVGAVPRDDLGRRIGA